MIIVYSRHFIFSKRLLAWVKKRRKKKRKKRGGGGVVCVGWGGGGSTPSCVPTSNESQTHERYKNDKTQHTDFRGKLPF